MEYHRTMYTVLGLNYQQKSCLVCNTPFISNNNPNNSNQQHIHQQFQLDEAFCKVFQVAGDYPHNSAAGHPESNNVNGRNHGSFCHSCVTKVQTLHSLQTQLELIQSQINAIRDQLGFCLVNSFQNINTNTAQDTANYQLRLKVFQKWSYKYQSRHPIAVPSLQQHSSLHIQEGIHPQHQYPQAQPNFQTSLPLPLLPMITQQQAPQTNSEPNFNVEVRPEEENNEIPTESEEPSSKRKKTKTAEPEQCFICGKLLNNDYLRKNHMQTHSDLRPYKCSLCEKSFANSSYLKMHEKTHDKSRLEGEPKFECTKCGRKYHLQKGLYKHTRYSPSCGTTTLVDHGKVRCQCELCGREFNSRYRLGVHVRGFHKKLRPVSCTICGRPCVDNQQRKKHELTHNPNPSTKFQLECPQCPPNNKHTFERKRDLERHFLCVHPNVELPTIRRPTRHPRKFACPICPQSTDATFTEKRALEYHMHRFHSVVTTTGPKKVKEVKTKKVKASKKRKCEEEAQALKNKKNTRQSERKKKARVFYDEEEVDDEGEESSQSQSQDGEKNIKTETEEGETIYQDQQAGESEQEEFTTVPSGASGFLQVKLENTATSKEQTLS